MVSSTASSSAMVTQGIFTFLLMLLPSIVIYGAIAYALYLLIRALRKYLSEKPANQETAAVRKSLGETSKEHRTRCNMTQEFVAEHLGVSRQAVSKWESGASDPSTANLLALAKLFGISAAELLKNVAESQIPRFITNRGKLFKY